MEPSFSLGALFWGYYGWVFQYYFNSCGDGDGEEEKEGAVKSIHNKLNYHELLWTLTLNSYWIELWAKLVKRFGVIPDAGKWEIYEDMRRSLGLCYTGGTGYD